MKASDLLLILLFIIAFTLPSQQVKPSTFVDMVLAEGIVAVACNNMNFDKVTPTPEPKVDCTCDGTGLVKSPDNVTDIPCPCDGDCRCESSTPPEPTPEPTPPDKCGCGCGNPKCQCKPKKNLIETSEDVVKEKEVHIMDRQILYFHSKSCIPCIKFNKEQVPELQRKNWGVDEKRLSYIKKLDYDEYPSLVEKYNVELIPTFILLKNGVEIDRLTGYYTAAQVTQLWTKHFK